MKEFNLPDLAQSVQNKHPHLSIEIIESVLTDAFTQIHENCIQQITEGQKVGRFEQNHGAYPFVLRVKQQSPKTTGLGLVPARYSATVRLGKKYPKPQ